MHRTRLKDWRFRRPGGRGRRIVVPEAFNPPASEMDEGPRVLVRVSLVSVHTGRLYGWAIDANGNVRGTSDGSPDVGKAPADSLVIVTPSADEYARAKNYLDLGEAYVVMSIPVDRVTHFDGRPWKTVFNWALVDEEPDSGPPIFIVEEENEDA